MRASIFTKALTVAVVVLACAMLIVSPSGARADEAEASAPSGRTYVYLPLIARDGTPAPVPEAIELAATPAQLDAAFAATSDARVAQGCSALVRDVDLDGIAYQLQRGRMLTPDVIRGALGTDDEPTYVGYYTPGAPLPPTLLDCVNEPRSLADGALIRAGLTPSDPSAASPDRWFIVVDR